MEAVRCQGLTKRYGAITALDHLDLAIQEGTIFGLLGPNGAGKTTTLRLLVGLGAPTEGRAWVGGEPVAPESLALRQHIGFLPEEPAFYGWMTGREFLRYVSGLFHLPQRLARERVEELLRLVNLQDAANRRVGGYSRGMRQRLGIAQALINRPSVLFLDEPCSALDPMGRREVLSLIHSLRGHTTVFMSTHILSDVERVCDVVGILDRGRLLALAPIEELKERYARPVFQVNLEGDVAPLVAQLRSLPWVARVETDTSSAEGTLLRVYATDVGAAKTQLPALIAASERTLLRYELTLPTLEEIFVELVKGRE